MSNRVWFDCEFLEDGKTIELISIGIVREDGAVLYRETENSKVLADSTDWLRVNVRPHLHPDASYVRARERLRDEIVAFVGDRPEWWAYYADYDWVVLCQLFGRMIDLPKGWPMYCRDLKQLADECDTAMPEFKHGAAHNALADALQCRDRHLWLLARGAKS